MGGCFGNGTDTLVGTLHYGSVLCALKPGRTEKGEAARKILKAFKGELDGFGLDDLLSVLPNGGVEIVKT